MKGARFATAAAAILLAAGAAQAQTLRFSNHRDIKPPESATLRIGPFYSTVTFSQSVGYRNVRSSGSGVDFLYGNRRGEILKDGDEFPMFSTLDFRNYLILTRHSDVDFSVRVGYAHFPMKTQEDEFIFDVAEEGIAGDLSFSTELAFAPFAKCTAFDSFSYQTEYIDMRGLPDRLGGQKYVSLANRVGANFDWLLSEDQNLGLSASRSDVIPRGEEFREHWSLSYSESATYQCMLSPALVAGVSAGFSQHTYPKTTNDRPDSASQTYSVFAEAKLTRQTKASAMAGYALATVASSKGVESDWNGQGSAVAAASLSTELSRELSHRLTYSRTMPAGFDTAFEIHDGVGYQLNWKGDFSSVGYFSQYNRSQVDSRGDSQYTDWANGVSASYPLCSFATLNASSIYSIRENTWAPDTTVDDPTLRSDYQTWSSQVGTSFAVTKKITFSTAYQHIIRTGGEDDLEFVRDIFSAVFTYSHQF